MCIVWFYDLFIRIGTVIKNRVGHFVVEMPVKGEPKILCYKNKFLFLLFFIVGRIAPNWSKTSWYKVIIFVNKTQRKYLLSLLFFSFHSFNDQVERKLEEKIEYKSLNEYLNKHEHFLKSVCRSIFFYWCAWN